MTDSGICCFASSGLIIGLIAAAFSKKSDTNKVATQTSVPPPSPPPISNVAFDPFINARSLTGIRGLDIKLFTLDNVGQANGVKLNDDFIAVKYTHGEVKAILLNQLTTASLESGSLPHYVPSRYHIVLSHENTTVKFPASFHGWLEIFDACKKNRGTILVSETLPEEMRLKVLGETIVKHPSKQPELTPKPRPINCPSCGANLNNRSTCEYCGTSL